jgi:hypothetical protein
VEKSWKYEVDGWHEWITARDAKRVADRKAAVDGLLVELRKPGATVESVEWRAKTLDSYWLTAHDSELYVARVLLSM